MMSFGIGDIKRKEKVIGFGLINRKDEFQTHPQRIGFGHIDRKGCKCKRKVSDSSTAKEKKI